MKTHINHKQLAWILGIKVKDARDKMVYAYCKSKGKQVSQNYVNGYSDPYPADFEVSFLETALNVPNLAIAVADIHENYLTRSATRSHILGLPLKKIEEALEESRRAEIPPRHVSVSVPAVLKSLLREDIYEEIINTWRERYSKYAFLTIKE